MGLFSYYPGITYDFTSRTDKEEIVETIQDTTTKISMVISPEDFENMCERYTIPNGMLPEHLSKQLYGTNDFDWTILYINGIANLNNEWPLMDGELIKYATDLYGAPYLDNIHHYEKLPENVVMDMQFIIDTYGEEYMNPITNIEHETKLNEQKRFIYVIKPENISSFVNDFKEKLS